MYNIYIINLLTGSRGFGVKLILHILETITYMHVPFPVVLLYKTIEKEQCQYTYIESAHDPMLCHWPMNREYPYGGFPE